MRVVITGFQPSESHPVNTSWEVKNALSDHVGGIELIREDMIGSYHHSIEYIDRMIQKYHPDAFICMGQALRRDYLSIEKIGINYAYEERDWAKDDDGFVPKGMTLVEGGPDGIFSNLPIDKMVAKVKEAGFPCEMSLTAGAIGCNNALYCVMYLIKTKYPNMMGGFIHVPGHHEHPRRTMKTYSVAEIAKYVEIALSALED